MTGTAVETEVVAAPAPETPAPAVVDPTPAAAPVAPVVEPVGEPELLSRREAKRGLHEDLRGKTPEPVAAPPAAETPAAPTPETPPADTATPPAPAAAQPTRVPIPSGHPMREMGVEFLTAGSPQEERAIRAAINGYVRRHDVAVLKAENDQLKAEKVANEARLAAQQTWQADPKYAATMARAQELRDTFGDEVAEQFLRGFNADFDRMAQQEYDQRMAEVRSQDLERAAQAWKTEAWSNATSLPEAIRTLPPFSKWFEDAVHSFNAELELGHYPQVQNAEQMHQEFMRFFSARLTAQPEVVGVYRSLGEREAQARTAAAAKAAEEQRRIDQIKQQAIDEYKRNAAATRTATPPHPLGNIAAASRERVVTGSEAASDVAADVSPSQLKKTLKAAARQDARQRFGV